MPSFDERHLFEMMNLEGAQAGLSWITILKKRDNYRRAFDGFDPEKMARYDEAKVAALLADAGIVRNRLKVAAAIGNARAYLALRASGRTLAEVVWAPFGGKPPEPGSVDGQSAGEDGGVGSPVERPRETGFQVRRLDDRLRLSAGGRLRQRPCRRLLPPRRGREYRVAHEAARVGRVDEEVVPFVRAGNREC